MSFEQIAVGDGPGYPKPEDFEKARETARGYYAIALVLTHITNRGPAAVDYWNIRAVTGGGIWMP